MIKYSCDACDPGNPCILEVGINESPELCPYHDCEPRWGEYTPPNPSLDIPPGTRPVMIARNLYLSNGKYSYHKIMPGFCHHFIGNGFTAIIENMEGKISPYNFDKIIFLDRAPSWKEALGL